MKIWCQKENYFIYPHPHLEEVAHFDFHSCSDCTEPCYFKQFRMLPYDAFMEFLRWWSNCPADQLYYKGYALGVGFDIKPVSPEELGLARLHYSLPSYLNGDLWNEYNKAVHRQEEKIQKVLKFLKKPIFKIIGDRIEKSVLIWFANWKAKLRKDLLENAVQYATKTFPSYREDLPHWDNPKLKEEVEAAGIKYDA